MSYEKIYLSLDNLYGARWVFLDKDDIQTALELVRETLDKTEKSLTDKNTNVLFQFQFDVLNTILDEELLTPFDEFVKNGDVNVNDYDPKHLADLVKKSKAHKRLKAALNNINSEGAR